MARTRPYLAIFVALFAPLLFTASAIFAERLLFAESFEDSNWQARGWYDGPHIQLDDQERTQGERSCIWHWAASGDSKPKGGGGRVHLPPVEDVILEFSIKHGADWRWTGRNYHPHEFLFATNADDEYVGPAFTYLTLYVEVVDGVPRPAMQDGRNIDQAQIGTDLTQQSEARGLAGCNGNSDGSGSDDCYRSGQTYVNGKFWRADGIYFSDLKGPRYKGDWHRVRARFQLNSIADGRGQPDGQLQYWYDGQLLIDERALLFRTGRHPEMKIDQFLMLPYYGPGVPHAQSIWLDDLRIYTDTTAPLPTSIGDSTWGTLKTQSAP